MLKPLALILLAALGPGETEAEGMHIHVGLNSFSYTWTITNRAAPPITRLSFKHQFLYNATVPTGWTYEYDKYDFSAWTDDPVHAIRAGDTEAFSAQVGTAGAVLGRIAMRFGTDEGELVVDGVWGPVRRPVNHTLLVIGVLVAIGLFEAWRVGRRS